MKMKGIKGREVSKKYESRKEEINKLTTNTYLEMS